MDRKKIIEGLETMRKFFGFRLPSQAPVFEAYQNILTDAITLLKEQEAVELNKTMHIICHRCGNLVATVEFQNEKDVS